MLSPPQEQSNYLLKNINSLSIISQITSQELIGTPHDQDMLHIETKKNTRIASYQGTLLHSKYNPYKEAEEYISAMHNNPTRYDALIVFEMGLGYIVEAFYKQFTDIPIIIIELDTPLITSLLTKVDYSHSTAIKNATIIINLNNEEIIQYLYDQCIQTPLCIPTQAAKNIYSPGSLQSVLSSINEYSTKININKNSLKEFRYRWISNLIRNLNSSHNSYSIHALENLFIDESTSILLCAGGPSLEDNVHIIGEIQQRMPIICVDTALHVLYRANIIPDFIVVVDPQYINTKHLDYSLQWALSKGSRVILDIVSSARIFTMMPSHTTVFIDSSSLPINDFFCEGSGIYNSLSSGGSVSTFALEICKLLGCKEVYTLGLDLSYPQKRSHSKSTYFERTIHTTSNILHSAEHTSILRTYKNTAKKILTHSYNNEIIMTDERLYTYGKWFEKSVSKSNLKVFSLVGYIAKISGIQLKPIEELLKEKKIHINTYRKKIATLDHVSENIDKDKISSNINTLIKELGAIKECLIKNKNQDNALLDLQKQFSVSNAMNLLSFLFTQEIFYKKKINSKSSEGLESSINMILSVLSLYK